MTVDVTFYFDVFRGIIAFVSFLSLGREKLSVFFLWFWYGKVLTFGSVVMVDDLLGLAT